MSSGVTEIANLPLKAGSNIHDPNTAEGTVLQDCLQTVLGVDGCQRAFWGTEVESVYFPLTFQPKTDKPS